MADNPSLRDRYSGLIDQIVQATLKGNIRSKEQVYQLLGEGISPGTGEIFEQCLQEQVNQLETQLKTETSEFKQAKAGRSLRAMQTIQGEWQRWQDNNQASAAITQAVAQIITADSADRLPAFLRAIDPNRPQYLNTTQLKQLANSLKATLAQIEGDTGGEVEQVMVGINRGLDSWSRLQDHLVSWIYEAGNDKIGFEGPTRRSDPWAEWAKHLDSPLPRLLFRALSLEQPVSEVISTLPSLEVAEWIELVIILHYLQQGLVAWFDRLIYDAKVSAKLSISSFLAFSIIWSQLAWGVQRATQLNSIHRDRLAESAFQITLQILRGFSQRSYFPLYGGVFASFPGSQLGSVVSYLDEPLKRAAGTQEKARLLTLIGASERAQGLLDQALEFHRMAREIAAAAGDRPCEIANLNHLSRTYAMQKNYVEAINFSQRALILSRQTGDRQGEANALVNLGYAEVFQAQQVERPDLEVYETAINYLQQGLKQAELLGDLQSQAYGFNSLGIAYLITEQPEASIPHLTAGLKAAQSAGDLYLQGLDLAYLAEAYYRLQQQSRAIYAAGLSMYYLERIASPEWRQPAGLLTILEGQMGDGFATTLGELRREFIAVIGVDGYDHLPTLIQTYRNPG